MIPIKVRLMKFYNALTPGAGTLSPISILETCIDVYKRLFAKVNRRFLDVYKRFGKEISTDNQCFIKIEAIAPIRGLRI